MLVLARCVCRPEESGLFFVYLYGCVHLASVLLCTLTSSAVSVKFSCLLVHCCCTRS